MKPIYRTHQHLSPLEILGCILYILGIGAAALIVYLIAAYFFLTLLLLSQYL